jgi:adenine-specific DNA-methyltransferase
MEKMKMHSPDLTQENIVKLAELFPNCVTEGPKGKSVDFDLLRQELSDHIVEGPRERYELNWPGKREAIITANAPIAKTLRPCREESVDFDTTQNLFIEGDNLDALKLLQDNYRYLGNVKMIYIDPPYNTGNDFIYEDDFAIDRDEYQQMSGVRDEEGNVLFDEERWKQNSAANGRFHSDWLSMMYPRLKLARNLLREDGVIFISIDDNEVHNLRKICDEVFGVEALFGIFQWRRRQTADNRNYSRVSPDHEYIVAYCKSTEAKLKGQGIDTSKYKNPDNDPRGPWASIDLSGLATAVQRPNLHFDIVDPETGIAYPPNPNRGWSKNRERIEAMIQEGRILFPKSKTGRPREKKFLKELRSDVTGFSTWLDSKTVGFTTNGTREVSTLFGGKYFDFPKPSQLLKLFVDQATGPDDLVLDFFAGSCTTAHAVMQLNAEDGGKRRFIMVQLPEPCDEKSEAFKAGYGTIAEFGKERIRRAGKKIKEEHALTAPDLDTGFRVLKVDSSNMADVYYTPDAIEQPQLVFMTDNVKPDRTTEDLLFQVLLDWGLDLSLPVSREVIAGQEVFFVDDNALAACFDRSGGITEELVRELAKREPLRVVFHDAGYTDDSMKINTEQLFKALSPSTEVKTL